MKQLVMAALVVAATFACTQRPAPVANNDTPTDPSERMAISVEYVAVPKVIVRARPALDAPPIGEYGLAEAVSVLEKKDGWCLVRTFSGAGWVQQTELVPGNVAETMDTTTPRFYVAPAAVPFRNARGELWLQARVNTDGDVVDVKLTKNTTGSEQIAQANTDALKQARFYPMVDQGTRKTFIYEHKVYY